ncbi:hypothetical protein ACYZT4_09950 [Pseudomonas sp. GB2N2]
MKNVTQNWQTAPLLHTEAKVISTPTQSDNEINCNSGMTTRYNVANIHEIKQFWNVNTAH